MKKVLLFLLIPMIYPLSSSASGGTLEISWKFLHVLNDYDHLNKIEVYIDGTLISTSEPFHESQLAKHIVKVPKGKHLITIRDFAYYNENWEEHLMEHNYSVDAFFSEEHTFKKKNFLTLVWDIDKKGSEALNYAWTKPSHKLLNESKPDKSDISLSISWKFTNVKQGFDHDTRIVVYADGKKAFTSPVAKGATGNSFKANLPKNTAEIKVVAEAFYEGTWEEHLVVHEYSLDAVVLKSGPFTQKLSLDINFDLKNTTVIAVWK
ncbi:MAG TPA: hypothetical protein VL946_11330, partial [Lacibacter sp.]|nr:hypothetical protein [Lacibacter sp.]